MLGIGAMQARADKRRGRPQDALNLIILAIRSDITTVVELLVKLLPNRQAEYTEMKPLSDDPFRMPLHVHPGQPVNIDFELMKRDLIKIGNVRADQEDRSIISRFIIQFKEAITHKWKGEF